MHKKVNTTSPGAFISDTIRELLQREGSQRAATPQDQALIDAINRFTAPDHIAPLALPRKIPEHFDTQLRELFYWVNSEESPYTTIYESGETPSTPIEPRYEALTLAVDQYLHVSNTSIMSGTNEFPLRDIPSDNERPRLWRRRIETGPDGAPKSVFEEVDTIDFTKKAVIGFGGVTQFHGNPRIINGFLKQMESAMGGPDIYDHGVELYAISYPVAHRTRYHADTYRYNAEPNSHVSQPAQQFTEKHIMPWLMDGSAHPSVDSLRKRFAALNFFGYSYGTVFVKEVSNAVTERLQAAGYSQQDISHVMANGYALNVGQTARIDIRKPLGDFSSVYVVSPNDIASRSKSNLQPYFARDGEVIPVSDNEMFIKSHAPKQGIFLNPDGSMPEGRNAQPLPTPSLPGHNVRAYTQPMLTYAVHNPSYIGSFMKYALLGKDGALKTTATTAKDHTLEELTETGLRHTLPGRFVFSALKAIADRESRGQFVHAF
jgi:hypothetical protein